MENAKKATPSLVQAKGINRHTGRQLACTAQFEQVKRVLTMLHGTLKAATLEAWDTLPSFGLAPQTS